MQFVESGFAATNHVDAATRRVVAALGAQLLRSDDAGQAWRAIPIWRYVPVESKRVVEPSIWINVGEQERISCHCVRV